MIRWALVVNDNGRTGVLIIRAWIQGEDLSVIRVRMTGTHDVVADKPTETTVASVGEACSIVEEWLMTFAADSRDLHRRDDPVTEG